MARYHLKVDVELEAADVAHALARAARVFHLGATEVTIYGLSAVEDMVSSSSGFTSGTVEITKAP